MLFFILILCLYFTLNFIAGQYADIIYVMCAKHYHEVNTRVPVNKRKKLKQCTFLLRGLWSKGDNPMYLSERARERDFTIFFDSFTARFIFNVNFINWNALIFNKWIILNLIFNFKGEWLLSSFFSTSQNPKLA